LIGMRALHFTNALLRIRPLLASASAEGTADAQLLERFVAECDEAAFAALVYRHGPMVLAVCRRMLGDYHAAEDALQATFLVLARKAPSILRRDQLANWLYGVAYRTALKGRALRARRNREQPLLDLAGHNPVEETRELRLVLDEEIHRLPRKHRAAFVLCYLEGRTQEDAARQMGCPRGTVATWVTRARDRLRRRLTKRGLAVPVGMLAAVSASQTLAAPVRAAVAATTVKAAMAYTSTGIFLVTPQVERLTEGVLRTMFLSRMKFLAAGALLAVVTTGVGFGAIAPKTSPSESPKQVVRFAPAGDSRAEALKKEKVELAKAAFNEAWQDFTDQGGAVDPVYEWSKNWLHAQLTIMEDKKDRTRAIKEHLNRMKDLEKSAQTQFDQLVEIMKLKPGGIRTSKRACAAARFYRAEAELWVEERMVN
jgi:RNA polymerase sigma factor (sigma-70 family)